jgi:hypothetical protein
LLEYKNKKSPAKGNSSEGVISTVLAPRFFVLDSSPEQPSVISPVVTPQKGVENKSRLEREGVQKGVKKSLNETKIKKTSKDFPEEREEKKEKVRNEFNFFFFFICVIDRIIKLKQNLSIYM